MAYMIFYILATSVFFAGFLEKTKRSKLAYRFSHSRSPARVAKDLDETPRRLVVTG
jgi:hypothetical protein